MTEPIKKLITPLGTWTITDEIKDPITLHIIGYITKIYPEMINKAKQRVFWIQGTEIGEDRTDFTHATVLTRECIIVYQGEAKGEIR